MHLFPAGTSTGESIAVADATATLSHDALDARAGTLAAALRTHGVGAGDVVAICLPRSIDQIVAMRAVWRAGAAYLPLDPAWPEARRAAFVAGAGCTALIATPDLGTAIAGSAALVSPAAGAGFPPLDAAPLDPSALAYVIYTSGSTGAPKAVEVTHANLAALVAWHNAAFGVVAGTRTSHLAGLGFDAAAWEVWPTLAAGGTLVLAGEEVRRDAHALHDWLIAEKIEVAFAPTALAEPLVAMAWPADTALRVLLTGADKLTVRPAPGLPFVFVNNYGPTESTVVATSGVVSPEGEGLPSIGKPIAGTEVYLFDGEGEPVPYGEEAEIFIGGAQLARGYRGDPALTAAKFLMHPDHGRLYRTGDLGAWLPNGELAFRGRVDGQVKIRGHRIEPAEIAAALNRLPEVATSAVVARGGELIAYVVPVEGSTPAVVALRGPLAETLPDYMLPSRFVALSTLPLNANGKLDVAALPDPATHALPESPAGRAPESATERRLLEIVSDVIGRSDIGVDDDFFLVGGHSLLGTQVVVRARDAFGVELTLFHLFEGRTVATLATIIEGLVMEMLDGLSDEEIARMAG
ncbi:MAG: non-ribosomal peptide synthetase [Sphingomonas sp.]|jgi:amino acid adenylation domain-containing protein|uniref:non-ribosomal peptide synthetase n=1 Tax=Sphingomonas sp. TaxID=28214 RepID=UPI003562B2DF